MKCQEEGCSGNVTFQEGVILLPNLFEKELAYSCSDCGRLYWANTKPVFKEGQAVFLRGGKLVK